MRGDRVRAAKEAAKKVKSFFKGKQGTIDIWDMSTKEARETQVKRDFENNKTAKHVTANKFKMLDDYYNNKPWSKDKLKQIAQEMGWSYIPPAIPDAYIQVESQIDNDLPSFQFNPSDEYNAEKAKQREAVVEAIVYENKVQDMITENERTNNILGNAFFKVAFDGKITQFGYVGKVTIGNPDPANIFPDKSAYDIDDCECFDYVYPIHRRKARREYGEIIDDIQNDNNRFDTEIYTRNDTELLVDDETMQVVEHWYRDNEGDIACTIQINNVEVRYIEKYWENTRASGNQMYPFIKYCKTPVSKSFWDKGEIEPIIELIDVINKITDTTVLNFQFCANDVILTEQGTFDENKQPVPRPGAVWETRSNKINGVKRLGGITNSTDALNLIKYFTQKIQETNGNFDMNMGSAPPSNVSTFSGMAILNEQGNKRQNLKKYDRKNGFRRLYELIDWTVLEFLNTDTNIMVKNPEDPQGPRIPMVFNSDRHVVLDGTGEQPIRTYPKVDIEIQVGEGIKQSKAITLSAMDQIAKTEITPANAEILKAQVDIMDLPNKDLIKDSIDKVIQALTQQTPQQGQIDEEAMYKFVESLPPDMQKQIADIPDDEQQKQVIIELMNTKGVA